MSISITEEVGLYRQYYSIKTNDTESYYDINFPLEWIVSDIQTKNGCGPTQCFYCEHLLYNGIFAHYCNKCLSKFVVDGKALRGNPVAIPIAEDSQLWLKAPYMKGVKIIDIGKEEKTVPPADEPVWEVDTEWNEATVWQQAKISLSVPNYIDDIDFDACRRENYINDDYDNEYEREYEAKFNFDDDDDDDKEYYYNDYDE
jgi:hypothetical protein